MALPRPQIEVTASCCCVRCEYIEQLVAGSRQGAVHQLEIGED
jgi:hypothetical protein